jgi:glucosamine 6-phosphate synthetase-like amidotransferase/phosphosugar isomerase protein
MSVYESEIWADLLDMPESMALTMEKRTGFSDVVRLMREPPVRRVVATGNGASYYVALALWLASLEGRQGGVEVVAVPGGMVAKDGFTWRPGDLMLVVSSSGEFRDLIEALDGPEAPPMALVTAHPESSLAQRARAVAEVTVTGQRAVTHTQAFCAAVLACLRIWADFTGDGTLASAVLEAPQLVRESIPLVSEWLEREVAAVATPAATICFGTGPAWAGAMEGALLIKEIARMPCEGAETREGATATMTALLPGHLALSLPIADDPHIAEAEAVCRARGAAVLRGPGGGLGDRRLAAVTTFAASLTLSVELAQRNNWNPDNPDWIGTYYTTARVGER